MNFKPFFCVKLHALYLCVFVCHCLATKVFVGKLPATRWVEVTMRYPGGELHAL